MGYASDIRNTDAAIESVDPRTLLVDPSLQFKSGADARGVTNRLKGVTTWVPEFAGIALVWEREDGTRSSSPQGDSAGKKRFIADGFQRRDLAICCLEAGQENVRMLVRVLREADGWTANGVRVFAAYKNIAEDTGTALDAARIIRAAGNVALPKGMALPPLPPNGKLARQGQALAQLAEKTFMLVATGAVSVDHGALVGSLVKDPLLQEAAIGVLRKTKPQNATQAEAIVRQVAETEVTKKENDQLSFFGDEHIAESLYKQRAQILDAAFKALRTRNQLFSMLVDQADAIVSAGNWLANDNNAEIAAETAQTRECLQILAARKGPVSDALTDAARALRGGRGKREKIVGQFLDSVRDIMSTDAEADAGGKLQAAPRLVGNDAPPVLACAA